MGAIMTITVNGATNTITAPSGLSIAGDTAVTGTLSASGAVNYNSSIGEGTNLTTVSSVGTQLQFGVGSSWSVARHYVGGVEITTLSSTGLAVTGTLSATGLASFGTTNKLYVLESGATNYFTTASNGVGQGIFANATQSGLVVAGSGIATATSTALTLGSGVNLVCPATVSTGGYTVATLPAGTVGQRAYVTDATAPTFLGALTGGGAVVCPVFYNGSAWVAG